MKTIKTNRYISSSSPKHRTQEELKQSARAALILAGSIKVCKTEECLIGSDMQTLDESGYCFSCLQKNLAEELQMLDDYFDEQEMLNGEKTGIF